MSEPEAASRARQILYVPVRSCAAGVVSIRTGRLRSGQPVGLAFTAPGRLAMVFGPGQPWIRLHAAALRSELEPLGITRIRVDPRLAGRGGPARAGRGPQPGAWRTAGTGTGVRPAHVA